MAGGASLLFAVSAQSCFIASAAAAMRGVLRCVCVCAGVNAQLVQVVNFDETLKCLAAGVYKLQVALNHPPPAGSLHAW